MLSCTVRDCGLPLAKHGRALTCAAGHSFDVARSGYINLLQPQDRRSPSPGDSREAVRARARLLDAGVGRALIDAVGSRIAALPLQPASAVSPVIIDLGSGTGDALAASVRACGATGVGVDLSTAAADHAARCFPQITWIVANADRRLPFLDHNIDVVLTLHGRRNPAECDRVLKRGGWLIAALPSADDLIELRTVVQGPPPPGDRSERLIANHEKHFLVVHAETVRQSLALTREAVIDLLATTYRGARPRERDRVASLGGMEITCASDLLVLRTRAAN